jgi:hypothetical protein
MSTFFLGIFQIETIREGVMEIVTARDITSTDHFQGVFLTWG